MSVPSSACTLMRADLSNELKSGNKSYFSLPDNYMAWNYQIILNGYSRSYFFMQHVVHSGVC